MIAHKDTRTPHRSSVYLKVYDSCGVAAEKKGSKLSTKRYDIAIVGFPELPSAKRKLSTEILRRTQKSAAVRKKKALAVPESPR